jgi:predicted CopG family antitoxin
VASKTLNITEDAYELLKARKRPGESFTDVITRLAGYRSLEELEGILTPGQADALEDAVREGRRRSRARRSRQARLLKGKAKR